MANRTIRGLVAGLVLGLIGAASISVIMPPIQPRPYPGEPSDDVQERQIEVPASFGDASPVSADIH